MLIKSSVKVDDEKQMVFPKKIEILRRVVKNSGLRKMFTPLTPASGDFTRVKRFELIDARRQQHKNLCKLIDPFEDTFRRSQNNRNKPY